MDNRNGSGQFFQQDSNKTVNRSKSQKLSRKMMLRHSESLKFKKSDTNIPVKPLHKPLSLKLTYDTLDQSDVENMNISRCRKSLGMVLLGKPMEYTIIILIIIYTLYVFVALALEDIFQDNGTIELALQIVEIVILGLFFLEVSLKTFAFRAIYICNCWNIFDILVIFVSITFVVLDILLGNSTLSSVFRVRGLFRLLRVFLVLRKMNELRVKSTRRLLRNSGPGNFKTPAEHILIILSQLIGRVQDVKVRVDLLYCYEMISKNRLYEAEVNEEMAPLMREWVQNLQGSKENKTQLQLSVDSEQVSRRFSQTDNFATRLSMDVQIALRKVTDPSFNPFLLNQLTKGEELVTLMMYLFNKNNWGSCLGGLDEKVLFNFIKKIQDGYKQNPYHNKTHACDVTQTIYYFCTACQFHKVAQLNDLDMFNLALTGAIHDYEHGGFNNAYLSKTKDQLAIRYNDHSVLQNHHVAAAFSLMQQSHMNIFKQLDQAAYKNSRQQIIRMVLGTDMASHFKTIGVIKNRLSSSDFDPADVDKSLCMETLLHFADISNPAKDWEFCYKWTNLLFVQFFKQGDSEASMNFQISDLMDRKTVNVAKSQLGFIDFIVKPCFEILDEFLPNIDRQLDQLENNRECWSNLIEEYEDIKAKGNDTKALALNFTEKARQSTKDQRRSSVQAKNLSLIIERRMSAQSYSDRSAPNSQDKQKVVAIHRKSKFESEDPHGPLLIQNIHSAADDDIENLDDFHQTATKQPQSQDDHSMEFEDENSK